MIAFGVCVRSQEQFDDVCLRGIVTHGGPDAALLTATDTPVNEAYNEILDAAADMADLEALVLLADDVAIDDGDFPARVRRAIADGTDVGGVIGASGGTGLDWWTWTERHGGLRTPRGEVRHDRGTTAVEIVDGSCLVLSPRAVGVLRFDAENFPSGPGADVDLCWQALERDLRVDVIDLEVTRHGDGSRIRGDELAVADTAFQAKWAHKIAERVSRTVAVDAHDEPAERVAAPRAAGTKAEVDAPEGYFGFERPELVALVPATAQRVLDVGCASGALGASIKRAIPGCEVSGVEYVQSVVDQAATRLDHAVQADLNGPVDLPFPRGYFDTMVFGDVLEHLLDPESSLQSLLPYLADDGRIVASIPNVKHWSVMIPALGQDRWEYTAAGLLDRTHVHLFTLTEIQVMLNNLGLTVTHLGANNIPLEPAERLDPLVTAAAAYGADRNAARTLFTAYQYLVVASRR